MLPSSRRLAACHATRSRTTTLAAALPATAAAFLASSHAGSSSASTSTVAKANPAFTAWRNIGTHSVATSGLSSGVTTPNHDRRRPLSTSTRHFSVSARSSLPRFVKKPAFDLEDAEARENENEEDEDSSKAPLRREKDTEKKDDAQREEGNEPAGRSSRPGAKSSAAASSAEGASGSASGSGSSGSSGGKGGGNAVAKQTVPSEYPQVLALPISRRPLFPGFYKAVIIKDLAVCAAIRESLRRGQPYIGAFLLRNENDDSDVITDISKVHREGVFAQITSIFPVNPKKKDASKDGEDAEGSEGSGDAEHPDAGGITAVLYPHRRIRIDELITPSGSVQPWPAASDPPPAPSPIEPAPVSDTQSKVHAIQEEARADGIIPAENDVTASGDAAQRPPSPFQTSFLQDYAVSLVNVTNLEPEPYDKDSSVVKALRAEMLTVFKDIASLNPLFRDQITNFGVSQGAGNVFEEPDKLADFAAAVSSAEVDELQGVLAALDVEDRLKRALLVLKKELMAAQLQQKISKDVEKKIQTRQREYFLHEQLKGIKKELGMESDGKDKLVEKFREKVAGLRMPEPVRKVFDEELSKLSTLEPAASEFNVTRGYLEWLTNIPWGVHSAENYSIAHATATLDEDHYGLKDVKDRILEFLAVGKLRGTVEGKIICLVGPPGVGKTSIGKSIARAVERQFFRFSVGGLSDVAEIKGHRRTYVGAMPGKAIQALKKVGTENPLILIDEVDKIGRGYNGDPSSALLEMLDPEQNGSFLDHYMDVPVDLSRVLFVCTANSLDTIPQPLLDRMEVMEVSSYTADEKRHIAKGYLAPQAQEASGLKGANVVLPDETIEFLIRHHARESGVRGMKKLLEKVYRKIAYNIVREHGEDVFPEPPKEATAQASGDKALQTSEGGKEGVAGIPVDVPATASGDAEAKESASDPTPTSPPSTEPSASTPTATGSATPTTTTSPRAPMSVPESVKVEITIPSLREYLGPPAFHKDRLFMGVTTPAGVSTGLGWLGNGAGSLMSVETALMPAKGAHGNLRLTGKLGDVIKESATVALSWLKANGEALGLTDDSKVESGNIVEGGEGEGESKKEPRVRGIITALEHREVHLHMPEGAIGKEGPSAGVAFITSLVSLLTNKTLPADLAMTGEVSLRGMVLPVGGLKEKLLAAHRAGITTVIIPAQNRPNVEQDVPQAVLDDITVHYVSDVWTALDVAFGPGPWSERARELEVAGKEEEVREEQREQIRREKSKKRREDEEREREERLLAFRKDKEERERRKSAASAALAKEQVETPTSPTTPPAQDSPPTSS